MEIYIESVIIGNLVINYILLSITVRVVRLRISTARVIIASILGAVGSLVYPYIMPHILLSNVYKICLALSMLSIALPKPKLKTFCLSIITLFLCTYALGGALIALGADTVSGGYMMNMSTLFILVIAIVYFALLRRWVTAYLRKNAQRQFVYSVVFESNKKTYKTFAYLDSGNTLTDPQDHSPVTIISAQVLLNMFEMDISNLLHLANNPNLRDAHYVEVKTISASKKILVFKIDRLYVGEKESCKVLENVSCGITFKDIGIQNCSALLNCTQL